VILSVLPYLVILAAFGGFVLWNNGVVLGKSCRPGFVDVTDDVVGHKEFHTAGLHLSQMLYIWPYFMFFSWPILIFPVINLVLPSSVILAFFDYGFTKKQKGLPKIWTAMVILPIMLAVVHFNTIIHPFTLADNRHYIFYVFRILRSHPAIKYAAVPAYFLCGWAVISAFGFSTAKLVPQFVPITNPNQFAAAQKGQLKEAAPKKEKSERKSKSKKANQVTAAPSAPEPFSPEVLARLQEHLAQRQKQQQGVPRASFVLVWLAATALSLVTAPLVEPRYFIIPWVMWRLHLPPQPVPLAYRQQRPRDEREALHADLATNFSLFMETYWFLAINAATGYIFLYKGFEWPQEPGKIQRFMW
jgi:alpha-1,2-glucosyltransferase